MSSAKFCKDCGAPPPPNKILPSFVSEAAHGYQCVLCKKSPLCYSCSDYGVISGTEPPFEVKGQVCKTCFKASILLDWSKNEDIIEEEKEEAGAEGDDVSSFPVQDIIMLHGGGASRLMYSSLAREIVAKNRAAKQQEPGSATATGTRSKFRIRCILPDLPGHGSRMDEIDLSTDRLVQVVVDDVVKKFCVGNTSSSLKPIVLGGSFGGYLAMELVGRHPDLFSAAVVSVAGQNVGKGSGVAASVALSIGKFVAAWSLVSSAKLTSLVLGQVPWKEMDVSLLTHDSLHGGFYFKRQEQMIAFLQSTDSRAGVEKFVAFQTEEKQPPTLLFANGGADHRDMENDLLKIAKDAFEKKKNNGCSVFVPEPKLIVYDGATHFYSASTKYAKVFMNDVYDFCFKVADGNMA